MVACISGCGGVIGFNVAMSPRPVREKVRPARLDVGASAKKFAQRAENTPKLVFLACWASFFAEVLLEWQCWANFFADRPLEAPC